MDGTQVWWQSKGVLGSVVAILAGGLGFLGLNFDASLKDSLVELISMAGTLVGGAIALYGRIVATKKIG